MKVEEKEFKDEGEEEEEEGEEGKVLPTSSKYTRLALLASLGCVRWKQFLRSSLDFMSTLPVLRLQILISSANNSQMKSRRSPILIRASANTSKNLFTIWIALKIISVGSSSLPTIFILPSDSEADSSSRIDSTTATELAEDEEDEEDEEDDEDEEDKPFDRTASLVALVVFGK